MRRRDQLEEEEALDELADLQEKVNKDLDNLQALTLSQRLRKISKEEMALRTKMLAKFEADEARERKNVLLRLEAKRNYVRDIEEQRLTKKNMYYEEIAREKEDLRQQEENEDFRRQVVAEARRRLLEEHASKLHGFLPKGVIKNREEFEILQRAAASKNQ